jgi:aspartokinase/homoserine dehydrogenase 1
MRKWQVHKFGGTSVASAERYRIAARLAREGDPSRRGVVVSAMSKVTDALIELTDLARARDERYLEKLEALRKRHHDTAAELLGDSPLRAPLVSAIDRDFESLKEVLRGVWHLRTCSNETVELVSGHGEIWSAQMLNAYFNSQGIASRWLDARKVLVVESNELGVHVVWEESQRRIDGWLAEHPGELVVITGFVASTRDGTSTTLRRNGSDYSASIFGALLDAESIVIWTDVDGVLSADPRRVSEAVVLEDLSYAEATELAYFGAKVVHPSTMAPAVKRKIPIWIKNTFNPSARGTVIQESSASKLPVKGFSTIEDIALVNVEGTGMMGVPGVARRLFGALKEVGVSVVMISQASSEHSICFAIPVSQSKVARAAVAREFAVEIAGGGIEAIEIDEQTSILAAVGDNMASQPGIAARFLGSLATASVNVRAIAQGSSERNISVVVPKADATRALRAAHSGFFLSAYTLSIGVIGTGGIGKTFLAQLESASEPLRRELKIDLRVRALSDSKRMLLCDPACSLKDAEAKLAQDGVPLDLDAFARHVRPDHIPHAVLIDCTASEEVARRYVDWIESGIHVITPNKKANTAPLASYRAVKDAALRRGRHYLYETTVGAGLPILNTLRELVRTGDRVVRIEGVLSGTLSFIFNRFSSAHPFSEIVLEAKKRGYTEPDPRDDLSGMDVARKLVILGREIGLPLELSQVKVESLVAPDLAKLPVDEFLAKLPSMDAAMATKAKDAAANGQVLRYVGRIEADGSASVSLVAYPKEHSFARIGETDNIVAFQTSRYSERPLIVQGPGAGREVTAGGVFADLLRLSSYLGAPL